MSIDMKEFTGAMDSAAEGQQVTDNSYQRETHFEEVEVHKEFLDPAPVAEQQAEPKIEEPSKQELNFKALREEVDRLKSEREAERNEFRQNLDILRANQNQQVLEPEKPKRLFESMDKGDVPNVGEIEAVLESQISSREANLRAQIEELSFAQQHPDYAEVLEKYTAPLLKQKPHLVQGIHGAQNKALYAYELGKLAQQSQETRVAPTQPSINAQKMVDNARKPSTLAQAGGQSVLSKADYYASMSDAQFMEMASKNLGEI